MSINSKMTALADEVRALSGTTDTLSIDAMTTRVQSANTEVSDQSDLIAQIYSALDSKSAGSGDSVELQEKTVTPSTSTQTVTPDTDYDGLSKVTVNPIPTTTQATPSISVSSAGLITASATQTAGYVVQGTKSSTKQLTKQAAQTITPGTADQTIASGRYLTGTQTIKGDANLIASNIKSGVSIFGITGGYSGDASGSGSATLETGTLTGASSYIVIETYDYYYDLSSFTNKLLVCLKGTNVLGVFSRTSTEEGFSLSEQRYSNSAHQFSMPDTNIVKTSETSLTYWAV